MLSLVALLIALLHSTSAAIDGAVVKLTMRDGVQLFALLYVPESAQPVGTVLMRTPYNTSSLVPSCQTLFTLGFACLVADERGRFNSGGDYTFFRSAGNDTLDTMNWVRTQAWSNGKFSWTGVSANGITGYAGAMAEPSPVVVAGMRSMFNMVSCSSMHRAAYQGGAFRTELISGWLKWNKENYSIPTVLAHENADDYWRPTDQSIEDRWRSTDYPVMHLSGFYDIFSNEQIRDALMFDAVGGPNAVGNQLLVIEPGGHCKGGEVTWPNATWGRVITQLWQLTLYQRTIGNHQVEYRNPESLAIWYALGSGLPSESGNVWLRSNFVEFVNVTNTSWYLNGEGSLSPLPLSNEATSSTFIADPNNPITTFGGNVLTLPNCGPHDQQKIETSFANNMVVFTSAPLTQSLFAHGMLSATLYVQSTAIDTDFNVKVTDVYPNTNQSMLIQDGVLRMRWRTGPDQVAPSMSSGQTYQIEVEIGWTSYVFSPGHRIRVAIASSNYPRFSLNMNNGEFVNGTSAGVVAKNTVVHDAMHLSALVIPSRPIADLTRLAA